MVALTICTMSSLMTTICELGSITPASVTLSLTWKSISRKVVS